MNLSMFSLEGRVALITGAARGLGLSMAEALAEAGALVLLNDLQKADAEEQARVLQNKGLKVLPLPFDVSDTRAAQIAIDSAAAEHGRIDILVNNAGIVARKRLFEMEDSDWDRVIDVNLKAVYELSRMVAVHMVKAGQGRIINLTSIAGIIARAGVISYVAAKHGVIGLTKALAAELGPKNICCNAIGPGYMLTEINRSVMDDKFFYKLVCDRTPLKRWGTPDELKGAVIFLASPAASFVNGHTLFVDGGISTTILQPEHVA